jgi:Flp pilus assembly protein CpaB
MAPGTKRSGGIFFLLALVVILLLVAVVIAVRFLPGLIPGFAPKLAAATPVPPVPTPMTIKVIILAQPVTRGGVVTQEMITLADIPQTSFTQGLFFTDPKDVINKKARLDLLPGTPLTPALLVDNRSGSVPSFDIPAGMVAISVPISRLTSVAYALEPGDHVNVMASFLLVDVDQNFQSKLPNKTGSVTLPGPVGGTQTQAGGTAGGANTATITIAGPGSDLGRTEVDATLNQPVYLLPSEPQRARLISQTLIQNAIVLWVGTFEADAYAKATGGQVVQPTPTAVPQGQQAAPPPAPPAPPDIITLVVSPQDAITLNHIMLTGPSAKINLALRSAGDTSQVQTDAVTLQFIMDQYKIPVPAKLPYGTDPRFPDTGLAYPTLAP